MIIDVHTHIYNEKTFKDYFTKAKNKVAKVLVMAWFKYKLEDLIKFTDTKDNLYPAGTVDVDGDIEQQLEFSKKLFDDKKLFGIKLYPGYQYFYPADDRIHPIAELCQKYNKPLIFHSGDVYDPENSAILKYSHPVHIDELAVKFPKCKIVISHIGFPYHLETANIVSKNENVFTEISGTLVECDSKKEAKNMLNQYSKDLERVFNYFSDIKSRIMFGTDYGGEDIPLNQIEPYVKLVKKLFNKKEQDSVFYKLAEKVYFT